MIDSRFQKHNHRTLLRTNFRIPSIDVSIALYKTRNPLSEKIFLATFYDYVVQK